MPYHPMPYTFMPRAIDAEIYLRSLQILDESTIDTVLPFLRLDLKTAAAAKDWEQRTGWKPYLRESADTTHYYDPPAQGNRRWGGNGTLLLLRDGLMTITSVTVGGTVMASGSDYWLMPPGAPSNDDEPYTMLRFANKPTGNPQTVVVVGKRGRVTQVPDDVFDACLKYALHLAAQEIGLQVTGGAQKVKDLSFEIVYGAAGVLQADAQAWLATYLSTVQNHQRVVL